MRYRRGLSAFWICLAPLIEIARLLAAKYWNSAYPVEITRVMITIEMSS